MNSKEKNNEMKICIEISLHAKDSEFLNKCKEKIKTDPNFSSAYEIIIDIIKRVLADKRQEYAETIANDTNNAETTGFFHSETKSYRSFNEDDAGNAGSVEYHKIMNILNRTYAGLHINKGINPETVNCMVITAGLFNLYRLLYPSCVEIEEWIERTNKYSQMHIK